MATKTSSHPNHLPKYTTKTKSGRFVFRIMVPISIRAAFGKKFVQSSLAATTPDEAAFEAGRLADRWLRVFAEEYGQQGRSSITKHKEGVVYALTHPLYGGWVKVGKAANPASRLSAYRTSDPFRRFEYVHNSPSSNPRLAEQLTQERLKRLGFPHRGEWFEASVADVVSAIKTAVAEAALSETP